MKIKVRRQLSLMLVLSLCLMSFANAAYSSSTSDTKQTILNGITYSYKETLEIDYIGSMNCANAYTTITASSSVPSGYIGAQATIYNASNGQFLLATSMKYNTSSTKSHVVEIGYTGFGYTTGTTYSIYAQGSVSIYNTSTAKYVTYNTNTTNTISYSARSLDGKTYQDEPYQVNENGLTYGSGMYAETLDSAPELIYALGENGISGYIYATDLYQAGCISSPDELSTIDETIIINVYAVDGITVLDYITLQ